MAMPTRAGEFDYPNYGWQWGAPRDAPSAGDSAEDLRRKAQAVRERGYYQQYHGGNPAKAEVNRKKLAHINAILADMGEDAVPELQEGEFTEEMFNRVSQEYSRVGVSEAADTALSAARLAEGEAQSDRMKAIAMLDARQKDPLYQQLRSAIMGGLRDPGDLDEWERLQMANLRHESATASRRFEQRMRPQLGSRGLPGSPGRSGIGTKHLTEFERGLERDLSGNKRNLRVARLLAERDFRERARQGAERFLASDDQIRAAKASLKARVDPILSPQYLTNIADVNAAIASFNEARKAGKSSFPWEAVLGAVGSAAGTFIPGIGTQVGGMLGSAVGGAVEGAKGDTNSRIGNIIARTPDLVGGWGRRSAGSQGPYYQ